MLNITKKVDVLVVENGETYNKSDVVVSEHDLRILLNEKKCANFVCTPCNLEELALGYLFSTRVIRSLDDIYSLKLSDDFKTVHIEIKQCETSMPIAAERSTAANITLAAVVRPRVDLSDILSCMESFLNKSELFHKTGAVHSCALIYNGKVHCFMEDIGRHNAFDKTIGAALCENIPLNEAVVLTTGRLPADMMKKIIYSGATIVASRSAPTDTAIELAMRHNITLFGFARGNRMNVYTRDKYMQV